MRKRLILFFVLALPSPGKGQAILNVEGLQGEEVEGVHGELSGRLRFASGNTDLSLIGVDLGVGFLNEHHWLRAYGGRERLEQEGRDLLNNWYLHFRYNYRFSERLRTFHFFQLQANQDLLLDQRRLLGSGLRYRVLGGSLNRLEVGGGIMLESERLSPGELDPGEDSDTHTVRMSNLVVGSGSIGEGRRWMAVVYYQPNLEAFRDYRLLGEMGLGVELIASVQLDVALTWRHDSRAPADLEKDDLGLKTGFTYRIR